MNRKVFCLPRRPGCCTCTEGSEAGSLYCDDGALAQRDDSVCVRVRWCGWAGSGPLRQGLAAMEDDDEDAFRERAMALCASRSQAAPLLLTRPAVLDVSSSA
jgi:hypothetical protein